MKCKKCQSENLVMRPNAKNSSATELICANCGTWQKFIGKEEIRLFEIRNQRSASKPSNADRIRGMSDEELAHIIGTAEYCAGKSCKEYGGLCKNCALDWLQQPAKEVHHEAD